MARRVPSYSFAGSGRETRALPPARPSAGRSYDGRALSQLEEGAMPSPLDRLSRTLSLGRCCPPPPAVSGLAAAAGGGSGEVVVTWDPLPAGARVRFYRVYERKGTGRWWQLAVVTDEVLGDLAPGKIGVVDAPDSWPWPSGMRSDRKSVLRRQRRLNAWARRAALAHGLRGASRGRSTADRSAARTHRLRVAAALARAVARSAPLRSDSSRTGERAQRLAGRAAAQPLGSTTTVTSGAMPW